MREKIIRKAIKISYDKFKPNPYQRRYHYAFAFDGKKIVGFAKNNPIKVNAKAYRMGQKFNIQTYLDFPFSHAESHLISQLLDTYNSIRSDWSLVVLRINRQGKILLSKPCQNCQKIIDSVGFQKVYWSIDKNTFGVGQEKLVQV